MNKVASRYCFGMFEALLLITQEDCAAASCSDQGTIDQTLCVGASIMIM